MSFPALLVFIPHTTDMWPRYPKSLNNLINHLLKLKSLWLYHRVDFKIFQNEIGNFQQCQCKWQRQKGGLYHAQLEKTLSFKEMLNLNKKTLYVNNANNVSVETHNYDLYVLILTNIYFLLLKSHTFFRSNLYNT